MCCILLPPWTKGNPNRCVLTVVIGCFGARDGLRRPLRQGPHRSQAGGVRVVPSPRIVVPERPGPEGERDDEERDQRVLGVEEAHSRVTISSRSDGSPSRTNGASSSSSPSSTPLFLAVDQENVSRGLETMRRMT